MPGRAAVVLLGLQLLLGSVAAPSAAELAAEMAEMPDGGHRRLSGGAMDELNRLLADIAFNIPDQDFTIITPKIAIDDIVTKLRSTTCQNLGIGDVVLRARKPSKQEVTLDITISDVTVQCACDWSYVWVWDGHGSATAQATVANHNQLTTSITFRSPDYGHQLPSLPPSIAACHTAVHFQLMKFDGKSTHHSHHTSIPRDISESCL